MTTGPTICGKAIVSCILYKQHHTEAESGEDYVIDLAAELLSEDSHGVCGVDGIVSSVAEIDDGDGNEEGILVLDCQ